MVKGDTGGYLRKQQWHFRGWNTPVPSCLPDGDDFLAARCCLFKVWETIGWCWWNILVYIVKMIPQTAKDKLRFGDRNIVMFTLLNRASVIIIAALFSGSVRQCWWQLELQCQHPRARNSNYSTNQTGFYTGQEICGSLIILHWMEIKAEDGKMTTEHCDINGQTLP